MDDAHEALTRTAQLLRMDVFRSDPADDHRIVDGLRATTARVVADRANLHSIAGQTALTTLYAQLVMLGLQVELDVADTDLIAPQPPLSELRLPEALVEYSADLIPGGSSSPADVPEVAFVLGDTPYSGDCVRVSGDGGRASVGRAADLIRWGGSAPYGPVAAAAAAAVDGVRAAVPKIAERLGVAAPDAPAWTLSADRQISLDLTRWGPIDAEVRERVDVVSGGAITSAFFYVLVRATGVRLDARVLEPEPLDLSNLNRYALARRSLVHGRKIDMLAGYSNDRLSISGEPVRVTSELAVALQPWSERVLVGVDDIRARWLVQEACGDSWIGVGSTSHDYVLVSDHVPDYACAGCTHPKPDDTDGPIPTIGFVSLWAGLVLALRLLGSGAATASTATEISPMGLEHRLCIRQYEQAPVGNCPVGCTASLSTG